ncbi:4654_t:CDS:2, partial [Scutellospora calospora]
MDSVIQPVQNGENLSTISQINKFKNETPGTISKTIIRKNSNKYKKQSRRQYEKNDIFRNETSKTIRMKLKKPKRKERLSKIESIESQSEYRHQETTPLKPLEPNTSPGSPGIVQYYQEPEYTYYNDEFIDGTYSYNWSNEFLYGSPGNSFNQETEFDNSNYEIITYLYVPDMSDNY